MGVMNKNDIYGRSVRSALSSVGSPAAEGPDLEFHRIVRLAIKFSKRYGTGVVVYQKSSGSYDYAPDRASISGKVKLRIPRPRRGFKIRQGLSRNRTTPSLSTARLARLEKLLGSDKFLKSVMKETAGNLRPDPVLPLPSRKEQVPSVGHVPPAQRGEHVQKANPIAEVVEEVTLRIKGWTGSREAADYWILNFKIPGYGGKTALNLIESGRVKSLERYLDAIEHGVYS